MTFYSLASWYIIFFNIFQFQMNLNDVKINTIIKIPLFKWCKNKFRNNETRIKSD